MGVEKAEAIASALAPLKLSYKRLTVESYRAIPYRVSLLNLVAVG
jgi:glutamine synthetase